MGSMRHLTISEVQKYTGLSRNTIMAWIRNGKLAATKTGVKTAPWLVPGQEVERVRKERIAELTAELEILRQPISNNTEG